ALCPLPNTSLFQFTWKAKTAAADIEGAAHEVTGHRVGRVAWRSIYQPSVRMVDRYRVARVFLAGDAAHVHPPAGGRGLNAGERGRAGRIQLGLEACARRPWRTRLAARYIRSRTSPDRGGGARLEQTPASNAIDQARRCDEPARPALPNEPPILGRHARKPTS